MNFSAACKAQPSLCAAYGTIKIVPFQNSGANANWNEFFRRL
jgi:hypothetical protein